MIVKSETGRAGMTGVSLMMREALDNPRVANWNELGGREAAQISPHADAAYAHDRRQHPDQVKRKKRQRIAMRILQRRHDIIANIDEDNREIPNRDPADDVVRDLEPIR